MPFVINDAPQQQPQQPSGRFRIEDAPQQAQQDDSFSGAVYRGLTGRGVGLIQAADDLTGQNLLSPAAREAAGRVAKRLNEEGEGTGVKGFIGEAIGDPLNMGPAKAANFFASGFTAPQENDTGITGRATGGAISTAVGKVGGAVVNRAADAIGSGAQYVANKTGLTDLASSIAEKYGANPTGTALYRAAQDAGLDIKGKTPEQIHGDLQSWLSGNIGQVADNISAKEFNPAAAHAQIANTIGEAGRKASTLYAAARSAAGEDSVAIPGLTAKLDSMISALDGNVLPGTSEANALARLKAVRGLLPESTLDVVNGGMTAPKVPVGDLLDLRSALNEGFDPGKYASRGDVPLGETAGLVRSAIQAAGENNPKFGAALTDADTHQAEMAQALKSNDVLARIFKPEDFQAYRALDERGVPLPDATRERATGLLNQITTPQELDAVVRALPADLADSMRAAKFKQLMADAGITDLNLDKNYDTIKASLRNNPEALKLLDNMKVVTEELNRRGVPENPDFSKANTRLHSAISAVWDAVTGHRKYAAKQAIDAVANRPPGTQRELTRFATDLANQAPGATAIQDAAQAGGNQAGKAIGIGLGRGYGSDQGAPPAPAPAPAEPLPDPMEGQQSSATPLMQRFAQAESGGNPNARNPNGTASGLLQFTDGTWAQMVAKYGKQTGIGLKDKGKPEAQQVMGQLLAQDNAKSLAKQIGRQPTEGELYAAHFLGAGDATKLIAAQGTGKQAILLFPRRVVSDNRPVFFDGKRPRTVEEVYQLLNDKVA